MLFHVGIDESNHGRFPVFYVAVMTTKKRDTIPGKFEKVRHVPMEDLNSTDITFKFVPVFQEQMRMLSDPHYARLIAYTELIRYFSIGHSLRDVLIDGELKENELELLVKLLHVEHIPAIVTGSHFDTTFGVVNDADYVASQLRRQWNDKTKHTKQRSRYLEHMITPRFEKYPVLSKGSESQETSVKPRSTYDGYYNVTGRTRGGVLHRI